MHQELGITQKAYENLLKRLKPIDIFKYLKEYGVGRLSLYYYSDEIGGSFLKPKYKTDLIAKAIFDSLTTKEKMSMFEYFEWLNNNPEIII